MFSTIEHSGDIIETNFGQTPWYDAIQSSIGSEVEANWPSNAFSLRKCDRLTEDADFGKTKIMFLDEARFDLGGYVNKQNCRIWGTENACTLKSRRTQNKSLFDADFDPEA